jgi:hypothetical protein
MRRVHIGLCLHGVLASRSDPASNFGKPSLRNRRTGYLPTPQIRGLLSRPPFGVISVGGDRLMVVDWNGRGIFVDPHTGAAKERFEFPFSDSLPPRSYTQLNTAADPTTGAWAAGMLFGAEWWVTDSKGRLSARRLIHRPAYRVSAATITVGNTTMPDPSARPTEIRYGVRSMTFDEEGMDPHWWWPREHQGTKRHPRRLRSGRRIPALLPPAI